MAAGTVYPWGEGGARLGRKDHRSSIDNITHFRRRVVKETLLSGALSAKREWLGS